MTSNLIHITRGFRAPLFESVVPMRTSFYQIGKLLSDLSSHSSTSNLEHHVPLFMYHVSDRPIHIADDQSFVMKPKDIISGEWECRHVRRICVSPTVDQCLMAIVPDSVIGYNDLYIYRTCRRVSSSVHPYGVVDASLTQERWLCRPASFKLVGTIEWADQGLSITPPSSYKPLFLDFSSRGHENDFIQQHYDYHRLRRWFKLHQGDIFIDHNNARIHQHQRTNQTLLNREAQRISSLHKRLIGESA